MRVKPRFIKLVQSEEVSAFVRADTVTTIETYSAIIPGSTFKTAVTCASNGKTYAVHTTLTAEEVISLIEYEE